MPRRNAINLVLLAAAIALGAALWLGPPGDEAGGARLTALTPDEIRTLEIEYPPEMVEGSDRVARLTLERQSDGWYLTQPIERPAREGRIVTALGVLNRPSDSCYALGDRDPADFGLSEPRLRLRANGTELAFGQRAADGRRYVQAASRMCLLEDHAYPLLAHGLVGLAAPALLSGGAEPLRIETPWARASRPDTASRWSLAGASEVTPMNVDDWSARWLAAQAEDFMLAPPEADHGRIQLATADGEVHRWRIAQMPPELVLVPEHGGYGLRVAEGRGEALLHPVVPSLPVTDTDNPRME